MEVGIVGDLIMSGALAHLDNIHVDWPKYKLSEEDSKKEQERLLTSGWMRPQKNSGTLS